MMKVVSGVASITAQRTTKNRFKKRSASSWRRIIKFEASAYAAEMKRREAYEVEFVELVASRVLKRLGALLASRVL